MPLWGINTSDESKPKWLRAGSQMNDPSDVFATERGWEMRHYKDEAKTEWWDEVLVCVSGLSGALGAGSITAAYFEVANLVAGTTKSVVIIYNEKVTVTGTPQLTVTSSASANVTASYARGSGTNRLEFDFTVPGVGSIAEVSFSGLAVPGQAEKSYIDVAYDSQVSDDGTGASFDIYRGEGGIIESVVAHDVGSDYEIGDTFIIAGSDIGGSDGRITTLTASGTTILGEANAEYSGVTGTTSGSGIGAEFTITRSGAGAITSGGVTITEPGVGYAISDTITILGTDVGGAAPADNVTLTVTGIADDKVSLTVTKTSTDLSIATQTISLNSGTMKDTGTTTNSERNIGSEDLLGAAGYGNATPITVIVED